MESRVSFTIGSGRLSPTATHSDYQPVPQEVQEDPGGTTSWAVGALFSDGGLLPAADAKDRPRQKSKRKNATRLLHKNVQFVTSAKPWHERMATEIAIIKERSADALEELLQCLHMFYSMATSHPVELIGTVISYACCVAIGAVHYQIVDPSFFKATGLLLAVLLSLRAKMAMGRRQKLMNGILAMMNGAKNILEIVGNEKPAKRQRLRSMLSFCFNEMATWVMMDECTDEEPSLDCLAEEDRDIAFVLRGKAKLHTSPRALLVYLRQFTDELFDPDFEKVRSCAPTSDLMLSAAQPLHNELRARSQVAGAAATSQEVEGRRPSRTLSSPTPVATPSVQEGAEATQIASPDASRGSTGAASNDSAKDRDAMANARTFSSMGGGSDFFAGKVDRISVIRRWHRNVDTELQNITAQFDNLLMYKEELHTAQFRWMLSSVIFTYVALYPWCVRHESTLVLGGTTIGMAFVFYGLNAMTEQLEDPVADHQQGFDLRTIFLTMFKKMDREEAVRSECLKFLQRAKTVGRSVDEALHDEFEDAAFEKWGEDWLAEGENAAGMSSSPPFERGIDDVESLDPARARVSPKRQTVSFYRGERKSSDRTMTATHSLNPQRSNNKG